MKQTARLLGIAVLGGVLTLTGYKVFLEKPPIVIERTVEPTVETMQTKFTTASLSNINSTIDFTDAAEKTVHAVVHVKNTAIRTQQNSFDFIFGNGRGARKFEQVGTGSGVIISEDGYIVTNNHVVEGATDLEITLNNQKKYKATVIGADPENDIALLKIKTDEKLAYIPFANSDSIKIGEWVLAVGNPYNLTSTVTAGIVSAKGRDLQGNTNVDSFIQTDAAVNPGNSGGALVNTRGELIGINTAISSKTGSFVGYSFAVPSNIAKKVVEDLIEFGKVQEAVLGIGIDLEYTEEGVKIGSLTDKGGAVKGGLKEGDIIRKIEKVNISKFSDLKGQLRAKRPSESVNITVDRGGKLITKSVKLGKRILQYISNAFNWELKDLSKDELRKFKISNGVKIIRTGDENSENSLKNYIIIKVNNSNVKTAEETVKILDDLGADNRYKIFIEMMNPNGEKEQIRFR